MAQSKREELVEGIVVEALPATTFKVQVDGKEIVAHLSGKMRMYRIRTYPGDKVLVKMSPDGARGIIMRRI